MTSLQTAVGNHFDRKRVAAVRHAWTVAEALDLPAHELSPDGVPLLAAVFAIPIDATHPRNDDDPRV